MGKGAFTIKNMKSIFNSLGSNYSIQFVSTSLWSIFFARHSEIHKLEKRLTSIYGDDALCLYKGRDAIEASLRVLLRPGEGVLTQAFSCYAVEEGIVRAGMQPIYVDISEDSTNMTVESLNYALNQNKNAKAVLIQHSLGIPADSIAIRNWCDEHGLLLIEDIAQGIGGTDKKGEILGAFADAIVFSFGRDKIIDAVSGGAVVFKNMNPEKTERLGDVKNMIGKLPFAVVYEDMIYPDLTSLIRRTHHFGLGKIVFSISKFFGLLGSPIQSKTDKMTWMHPAYAKLALLQFNGLERQIAHRKMIAREYQENLKGSNLHFLSSESQIEQLSNLRFSVRCKDLKQVEKLVLALKKHRIYISDRWYRKPIDFGSLSRKSVYKSGSCPNAEELANKVINFPTHREITKKIVRKICKIVLENL